MSGIWDKALAASRSARLLLQAGDPDGAVNRAYYAMFDAARAALSTIDPELAEAKTHKSVLRRFGLHLVATGKVDAEMGRALNETVELRLAADYEREPTGLEEAKLTLNRMDAFLLAIEPMISRDEQL